MNLKLNSVVAGAALLVLVGCKSSSQSPPPSALGVQPKASVELMGKRVQTSVACAGVEERVLPDGRLEVVVRLFNKENRRIEVQANCVFESANGFSTGDETPYQPVILTEGGTEQVLFTSLNNLARKYTVHVREAR
jgi:uncharacterized protein YcfL